VNGSHYFAFPGRPGFGWYVARSESDSESVIVAGPYTTLAQAHDDALDRNAELRAAQTSPDEAPATAAAGASDVARNALLLTFERYDAILADLAARIALHEQELDELRRIVGDDGAEHSVRVCDHTERALDGRCAHCSRTDDEQ
jgi:hypothetical protein